VAGLPLALIAEDKIRMKPRMNTNGLGNRKNRVILLTPMMNLDPDFEIAI